MGDFDHWFLNEFSTNTVKSRQYALDVYTKILITENTYIVDNSNDITDPVNKAIDKFKNHPSILLIQSKIANDSTFSFNKASFSDIDRELTTAKLILLKIYLQKF